MTKNTAVTLLSGGLDSTVLAYFMRSLGYEELICLSFDYGQRHSKELEAARQIAGTLDATHEIIELRVRNEHVESGWSAVHDHPSHQLVPLGAILKSSLTGHESIPEGHYADESMKSTVVPNRNAIMLSIAYGVAVSRDAAIVAFAPHSGDHAIYPDCREPFVTALNDALYKGNRWDGDTKPLPALYAPFVTMSKADIVKKGAELGVPFAETWSCYQGGEVHCGKCGTCVERIEAFMFADVPDPTSYAPGVVSFTGQPK